MSSARVVQILLVIWNARLILLLFNSLEYFWHDGDCDVGEANAEDDEADHREQAWILKFVDIVQSGDHHSVRDQTKSDKNDATTAHSLHQFEGKRHHK